MKRVEKRFVKIDFKNAQFEMTDGELYVIEYDKDDNVVEETKFMDAIEDLLGEQGVSVSIKKENDIEE